MSEPSAERRLKFHLFMNGNDGYMPHKYNKDFPTNYIDPPNSISLPIHAQDEMRRFVSNLQLGELLGFDSAVIMEQRVPAIYPSATIMAAWLLASTKRIPIGAHGPTIASYANPLKIAEEIAMIDVLSGGRLAAALPLGTGPVYYHMNTNPTTARRRHREGVELFMRALREPGPFEFRGEFFNLPYVNLWPKPLNPNLEIWMPASGARESQVLAAEGRHTYITFLSARKGTIRYIESFRKIAQEEFGYDPPKEQIAAQVYVHVAETDAQARKEAEPHLLWFYQNILRGRFEDFIPPGVTPVASLQAQFEGGFAFDPASMTYDRLIDEGLALVGSPETVTQGLERLIAETGAGQVVIVGDSGTAPEWLVRKSLEMFAREVIPKFRPAGAHPVWEEERPAGYTTLAEAGARWPQPEHVPLVDLGDGEMYHVQDVYIDELRVPVTNQV